MKKIRSLGLRWLLPPVLTVVSAAVYWYGTDQDRIAQAAREKTGWHQLTDLPYHPLTQLAYSLNAPALIAGAILSNRLPERTIGVIGFCFLVPFQWWILGRWADSELGFAGYRNRVRPPMGERTLTLTCIVSIPLFLIAGVFGRGVWLRVFALFWVILILMSFVTMVNRWRRHYWGPR